MEKENMKTYRAGVDVGSTTVKLTILDDQDTILFGAYSRHQANTQASLAQLLKQASQQLGDCALKLKLTGS